MSSAGGGWYAHVLLPPGQCELPQLFIFFFSSAAYAYQWRYLRPTVVATACQWGATLVNDVDTNSGGCASNDRQRCYKGRSCFQRWCVLLLTGLFLWDICFGRRWFATYLYPFCYNLLLFCYNSIKCCYLISDGSLRWSRFCYVDFFS
jgi:hypothetical protein